MEEQEQYLVSEVRTLFYECKLGQCIDAVDKLDIQRSFYYHKFMQYFKMLSLFESQQNSKAQQCFENLLEENSQKNEGKIEDIDVMLMAMYQFEIYYTNVQQAEELNSNLYKIYKDYKSQHLSLSSDHQKAIYLFGKGMYLFVENSREQTCCKCIKLIERAIQLTQNFKQEMLISLGWIYYIYQQTDLSCKINQELYILSPKYPNLANNLAIVLHQIGKCGLAEKLFLEEEKLRSQNQITIQNIAHFYFSQENIQKEKLYYEKLISIDPKTPKIYHLYGKFLMRTGQKQKGIEMFFQGLQLDLNYCPIYQDLSDIEIGNGNLNQAKEYIEKCIKVYPRDGFYMYRYANCLEALGRYEEAIEVYKKSIKMKNYIYYKIMSNSNLGKIYQILNKHLDALEEFLNACNYQPVKSLTLKFNVILAYRFFNENSNVSLKDKIKLINKQNGYIVTKFEQFAESVTNKNLQKLFLFRLDNLREVLTIIAYQKYIESHLIFQSQILHWDLFFD